MLILKRSLYAKECPGMGDLPRGKIENDESYDTVHVIGDADYTKEQLNAWTPL